MAYKVKSKKELLAELAVITAAQKDPRKFGLLYTRYHHDIFLFVFKRIGEENTTVDVVSQVFLKALQAISKYTYQGVPFSSWLYRIALNEVNLHYRKSKKNRVVSIDDEKFNTLANDADEPSQFIDMLNSGTLVKIMDQLDEHEILLLELRYFEGRPFREVAEITGLTETNTKVKVHRLLKKMKNLIG